MKRKVFGRILSIVLAAALALSPTATAYAASENTLLGVGTDENEDSSSNASSEEVTVDDEDEDQTDPADPNENDDDDASKGKDSEVVDDDDADEESEDETSESVSDASTEESSDESDAAASASNEEIVEEDEELTSETSGSCGQNATFEITGGVLKISGTGSLDTNGFGYHSAPWYSERENITEIVVGEGITAITHSAFQDLTKAAKVTLPGTLTTIEYYAFKNTGLTSVTIPSKVTTIGEWAFGDCSSLATVIIQSKGITSKKQDIFKNAAIHTVTFPSDMKTVPAYLFNGATFNDCSITIPDSVTEIGEGAFSNATGSLSVNFGSGSKLSTIGSNAFRNSKLGAIDLPSSTKVIGNSAFAENNLTGIIIPENVTTIETDAFAQNGNLTTVKIDSTKITDASEGIFKGAAISSLTLNSAMKKIPDNLFKAATFAAGTNVTIPASVTTIGKFAFYSWNTTGVAGVIFESGSQLTTIDDFAFQYSAVSDIALPETLKTIGKYAFADTQLSKITIPSAVTGIGESAFSGCRGLTEVDLQSKSLGSVGQKCFSNCSIDTVKFPAGIEKIPENLFYQARFNDCSVKIPATVKEIGNNAFYAWDTTGISSLTFDSGSKLTTIGSSAFANTPIDTVQLPESLVTIGANSFQNTKLTSVRIPSKVTTIGDSAFANAPVEKVDIASNVLGNVSTKVFMGCSIDEVKFPAGITKIPENLFYQARFNDCSVKIPATVKEIGNMAFYAGDTTGISGLTFDSGSQLTTIGSMAFACTPIDTVELPESLVTIGANSFQDTKITSVRIPSKVTTIGGGAFRNASVEKVDIASKALVSVGNDAFRDCSIEEVKFPAGIIKIPDNLFLGAKFNSCFVVIPATVKEIGKYAFYAWDTTGISSLTFESGSQLTTIGNNAFEYTPIDAVSLPGGLKEIGDNAFAHSNLYSVVIPSGVTKIGRDAFYMMPNLEKVTIPASVTDIGYDAFRRTDSIKIKAYVTKKSYAYEFVSKYPDIFEIAVSNEVKYVLGGGVNDGKNVGAYEKGDIITLYDPKRVGYTFEGWYTDSKFTKSAGTSFDTSSSTDDITFYAKWTVKTYTITYSANGSEDYEATVTADDFNQQYDKAYPKAMSSVVPVREGFSFLGWFTEPEGGIKITPGTTKFTMSSEPVTDKVCVYAHWAGNTYTVKFHSNGAKDTVKTQKFAYGTMQTLTKNPFTQKGGRFIEWNTEKDGTGRSFANEEDVKDLTKKNGEVINLYAQWKYVDFVVVLDAGDGGENGILEKGDMNLEYISEEELGLDLSGINKDNAYIMAMDYGEALELGGKEFVKPGYTLSGWKNSKTGRIVKNGTFKSITDKTEIVTFTAQWKLDTYKVKYVLNGGTYSKKAPKLVTSYTVKNERVLLPNICGSDDFISIAEEGTDEYTLSKKGYKFDGWFADENYTDEVMYLGKDELRSMTLRAKWTPVEYTVLINPDGINGFDLEIVNWGEPNPVLNYDRDSINLKDYQCSITGHKLTGWTAKWTEQIFEKSVEHSQTYKPGQVIKNLAWQNGAEVTLTADYVPVKGNKVTLNLNGGALKTKIKKYDTGAKTEIGIPTRTGYDFAGWELTQKNVEDAYETARVIYLDADEKESSNYDVNTSKKAFISENSYGDVILTAKWADRLYTFGYYDDENKPVTENVDIEIDFRDVPYSGTLNFSGLASMIEKKVPVDSDKHGKSIVGFSREKNGKVNIDLSKVYKVSELVKDADEKTILYYPVWGEKINRITYILNGATAKKLVTSYSSDKNTKIAAVNRPGYVFSGWSISDPEGAPLDESFKHSTDSKKNLTILKGNTGDIKLEAMFTPITYTVSLAPNGSGVKDSSMKDIKKQFVYGTFNYDGFDVNTDEQGTLPEWTRPGYSFMGFGLSSKATVNDRITDLSKLATGKKVTLYAIWKANRNTIAFSDMAVAVNTGKVIYISSELKKAGVYAVTYLYGNKSLSTRKISVAGYTFKGWKIGKEVDNGVPVLVDPADVTGASVKASKDGYVSSVLAGNDASFGMVAVFEENSYKIKISSNGGVSKEAPSKAVNKVLDGSFKYTDNVADNITEYCDKFSRKGYSFAGFALDAKGKKMLCDKMGNCGAISGLSTGNNKTVTVYAVWEKVVPSAVKTLDMKGYMNGLHFSFKVDSTSADTSYDVQCSSGILFRRNATTTFTDVDVTVDEKGIMRCRIDSDKILPGKLFVRVRQTKTDSQNNAVTGKWSWPVRVVITEGD